MLPHRSSSAEARQGQRSFAGALVLAPPSARGTHVDAPLRRCGHGASPRAGCACAATGGGAASTAASCSPTTPTGPRCCGRSRETGASRVLVTHGHSEPLARYLREQGLQSGVLRDRRSRARRRTEVRRFADLYDALDSHHLHQREGGGDGALLPSARPPEDAAWALYFLTGRRLKRLAHRAALDDWTLEATGHAASWLFDECYAAVGDGAETIALLARPACAPDAAEDMPLVAGWLEERMLPLRELDAEAQRARVLAWWRALPRRELFLLNKLLTGELRVGVSRHARGARARAGGGAAAGAASPHRLMGTLDAVAPTSSERCSRPDARRGDQSRPYPFFLASPLEGEPSPRSARRERVAGGVEVGRHPRAAHPPRGGDVYLWSRGEELITDRFPEIAEAAARAARTAPCSTARCSRSRATGRCPSPRCSGASAGRS